MKVIDLTHTISENISLFPGTEKPILRKVSEYEKNGFSETEITLYSHVGTHIDPPAHIFEGGKTLDEFPVEHFIGKAVVIDCKNAKGYITMELLKNKMVLLEKADFLIFNTDCSKFWKKDSYLENYPHLSEEVCNYILNSNKKGIGIDAISIDDTNTSPIKMHKKLLKENRIIIIENLTNLDAVGDAIFTLVALPLKYENSDGAPARIIAILD